MEGFRQICLMILEKILQSCNYQVTTCQNAQEAVSLLQDQNDFDIMMIDVYMEHMNGLELVKHICEQTNLPVIAMSSNDDEDVIKEGFKSGACDYLVKPIRVENVRHIWMNVCRAQRQGLVKKVEQSWSNSVTNMINESNSVDYQEISENCKSSSDGEDSKCAKKRKLIKYGGDDNQQDNDVGSTRRKKRVIWTPELHLKFVEAMNQIGNNSKAVPKKILELMNVPGLTRENVASHLQKYRQYLKRLEHYSHKQSGKTMNLVSSQKQSYQTMSSITNRHNNVQAQVIATSSLQVRSIPSPKEISFGSETLEHRKHISGVEQILSFNQPQPQQIMGQMTQTRKFHALANNETMATIRENPRHATDGNLAIVEHVEGSNVIYHPFASYAYSKIDSKTHLIGTPLNTFCLEDNNVKREATSFFVREMTSSIGGQHYGDYLYENVVDLGYNDASPYVDEQVDPNAYPCN